LYSVKADVQKNRLYVTLEGFFEKELMKECTDKTIEETKKLKRGFDVITDLSNFKPVGKEALAEVARGQSFFKQAGIRHGIRVESTSALTTNQFDRLGKSVDYNPNVVKNVLEAERLLDSFGHN
jgi:hypothetical protein